MLPQEPQAACWWKRNLCSSHTTNKWQAQTHSHLWHRQADRLTSPCSGSIVSFGEKKPSVFRALPAAASSCLPSLPIPKGNLPMVKECKQGHYHIITINLFQIWQHRAQHLETWSKRDKVPPGSHWSQARRRWLSIPAARGALMQLLQLREAHTNPNTAWQLSATSDLRKGVSDSPLSFTLLYSNESECPLRHIPPHWNMRLSENLSTRGFQIFFCRWRNPAAECYFWKHTNTN